jgi:hypothetical protein
MPRTYEHTCALMQLARSDEERAHRRLLATPCDDPTYNAVYLEWYEAWRTCDHLCHHPTTMQVTCRLTVS